MNSLKQKTVNGLFWSFLDQFASAGITFIIGILLARVLLPSDFGLIGMVTVFLAVSECFVNSGFSSALIRKVNCNDDDYSTVFYYNLFVAIIFFIILFFLANPISYFFKTKELTNIIRVLGVGIVIDSFSIIQRTIIAKRVDFKLQTKVSIFSAIFSGFISVLLAYNGFGVWSLIFQRLTKQFISTMLLWYWNTWIPKLIFSTKSFNELFGFGSKLLASSLLDTLFNNIYLFIIGKYFTTSQLGYFTRAQAFSDLPSQGLTSVIYRVTYPVLSNMQNDQIRLKNNYKKIIRGTMFITFIVMLLLMSISDSLILALIGERWEQSIVYLRLLSVVGIFYPLHALNLNILQVFGRSSLVLKLEIIKKFISIPIIWVGIKMGVETMIYGIIIGSFISYFLNSFWSGKLIRYSSFEQIQDVAPALLFSISIALLVYFLGFFIPLAFPWTRLLLQLLFAFILLISFGHLMKFQDFIELKSVILNTFRRSNK